MVARAAVGVIPGGTLSGGAAQVSYTASLNATGGSVPYSWTLLGGALPKGLSLSNSGRITDTPSVPGTYSFTLQATDTAGATVSGSYTIVIAAAPLLLLTGNSLPNGIAGNAYPPQIFSASGGVPLYTFTISAGVLPPGLSFTGGVIGGISTATGAFPLTVTVTDAANKTSSASLSIRINPAGADLILSDTSLNFAVTAGASGLPNSDNVYDSVECCAAIADLQLHGDARGAMARRQWRNQFAAGDS